LSHAFLVVANSSSPSCKPFSLAQVRAASKPRRPTTTNRERKRLREKEKREEEEIKVAKTVSYSTAA
jgi:hypothetical protein